MPLPDTLDAWLAYVESLHHRPIDMGLDRVRAVAGRLNLHGTAPDGARRIVVGGTNGKGSTCAMLDAILRACLLYTSPSPRDGLLSRMPSSA